MKKLTENEEKMLHRYQRCSITLDSFLLLKSSALASNKLMNTIEETFKNQEITNKDYDFLKMLSEKKAKNYKTLMGIDFVISLFSKLKEKSFDQIKIEETI